MKVDPNEVINFSSFHVDFHWFFIPAINLSCLVGLYVNVPVGSADVRPIPLNFSTYEGMVFMNSSAGTLVPGCQIPVPPNLLPPANPEEICGVGATGAVIGIVATSEDVIPEVGINLPAITPVVAGLKALVAPTLAPDAAPNPAPTEPPAAPATVDAIAVNLGSHPWLSPMWPTTLLASIEANTGAALAISLSW